MRKDSSSATLSVPQASAMLIGVVIGVGIFKTPPIVAANTSGEVAFVGMWVLGGLLTLIGALCYAELGSSHPHAGGEFHYLQRAYGRGLGFLFAWGRMTVIQTGAIAAVAFAYGDYANTLVPLGAYGPAVHAGLSIAVLTGLQLLGAGLSGRLQVALTLLTILAVLVVAASGFAVAPQAASAPAAPAGSSLGFAMVFILLTYGGWNEAAYLSGEVRDVRRNMARVLVIGTVSVAVLYVLINLALVSAAGLDGLRQETVVTEPVERVFGRAGVAVVALIVCATALSTINATIFTGARSMLALGESFPPLAVLSRRHMVSAAPHNALLVQLAIALPLILFAAMTRDGFTAMVEYTAPVFWVFMFLVGVSLFLFRWREPDRDIPFRVPFYPLTPLVFCATTLCLLYASLVYTGAGALIGVAILAAGVPVFLIGRRASADTGRAREALSRQPVPGE